MLDNTTEILFIGGGSQALKDSLKDSKYKLTFLNANDSIYANVIGMNNFVNATQYNINNKTIDNDIVQDIDNIMAIENNDKTISRYKKELS